MVVQRLVKVREGVLVSMLRDETYVIFVFDFVAKVRVLRDL
jgi:hypothetical protein